MQNDCTIFTGLLSVYGSGVTTNTFDTILQLFHDDFPSFIRLRKADSTNNANDENYDTLLDGSSTTGSNADDTTVNRLVQYGITRLNISDAYTQIISKPTDPTSDQHGWDLQISVRFIIAFLLMILCIVVGIYIIGRYMYMKRQIELCNDRLDKDGQIMKANRWKIFRKMDETDSNTEMSSSSSSSSSSFVSTWGTTIIGESNVRTLGRNPMRRRQPLRRSRRTPMELTLPGRVIGEMNTDSIYIVESEEEEDDDDDADDVGNANTMMVYTGSPKRNERFYASGTSSLLSDEDTERYNFCIENDPLYIESSGSIS